jgi:hypothetical protein
MPTLEEARIEAAMRCGAGFASTCSGAGTTTTLIDVQAVDQGTDANFASGGWIYRPDAPTAADYVRRITNAGFDPDTGTWTVSRAWADAPDDDEVYYVFAVVPPIDQPGMPESWNRLINRALGAIWYEDTITIGSGDGSFQRRFPISDETGWVANEQHIKQVLFRRVDSDGLIFDQDQKKNGRDWDVVRDAGVPTIVTLRAPTSEQDVVVVAVRKYPALSDDDDETTCPLELLALRTRYELYRYLNAAPASQGQYGGEEARAQQDWISEYDQYRPGGGVSF